jgi:putative NIF3 family GTP cyclohydrolase 1 type 2
MNVKQVVDKIIDACDTPPLEKTCDLLIAGDWNCEVTGIVTTFMATAEVIKAAVSQGANLIITHEPTYFTGLDQTEWLQNDDIFLQKMKLIDENKINIWRFHDHMHITKPDKIFEGIDKDLGWKEFRDPMFRHCYTLPETTVSELADFLKKSLVVKMARIVGDVTAKVERVGFLGGGGSLGLGREEMPAELMRQANLDALICGDITEWTTCAYVRDASQLGFNKSMIILGHNRTEEAGMKYLPEWLSTLMPEMTIRFIEAGEPFSYL